MITGIRPDPLEEALLKSITEPVPPTPRIYLTHAERKVLGAFTHDGASNSVVSKRLRLSEDTVKSHMRHISAKARRALDLPADAEFTRTHLAVALLKRRAIVVICHEPFHHDPDREAKDARTVARHENHVCDPDSVPLPHTRVPVPRVSG